MVKEEVSGFTTEIYVLASEHTTANPSEKSRLLEKHPNTNIDALRRYIGRDVTRAFGLAFCKWGHVVQERLHSDYLGEVPNTLIEPGTQETPFITAEPEIRTFQVQPQDVLIIGNRGFWNSLTSTEAVTLSLGWLMRGVDSETPHDDALTPGSDSNIPTTIDKTLRVSRKHPGEGTEDTTKWYKIWNVPKKFTMMDNNPAVHLTRNALGGANCGLTESLLKLPDPFAVNSR